MKPEEIATSIALIINRLERDQRAYGQAQIIRVLDWNGLRVRRVRPGFEDLEFRLNLETNARAICELEGVRILEATPPLLVEHVADTFVRGAMRLRGATLREIIDHAELLPFRFNEDRAKDLDERRRLAAKIAPAETASSPPASSPPS